MALSRTYPCMHCLWHSAERIHVYSKGRCASVKPLWLCVCIPVLITNDFPRVAQWYGTIAAHTKRHASVPVVFVVFCLHMYSFAGLIRWTPPPAFSDTAVTDRHSDTTILHLRADRVRISWSVGSENCSDMCPQASVATFSDPLYTG